MATPPTNWLTDQEQCAWRNYQRMRSHLNARLESDMLRDSGLSGADYEVLVNLSEAPEGRLRAKELSGAIQWEKSRLSHHVARMERRGLVRREDCPSDARSAFVVLTEQGREAIEKAAPNHVDSVRRYVIDALSPEQLEALSEISRVVLAALDDRNA